MEEEFSLFEYYSLTKNPNVLICYRGPVSDVILREISKDIRAKFSENVQVSRKIFAIYMELAQNILYYSSEKIMMSSRQDSVGTILLTQSEDNYVFSCGNLVENRYLDELVESCEIINSMNRDELREYKRQQRSNDRKERSRGAGIGLIQVALTSRHPLKAEYRKLDEVHSFFSLAVRISKLIEPDTED
ncbi:MAG: SiaB family protein kinase [Microscillaceae bacterium]|jgi:hypothetical protein|nr:SiaB family protein kinase [Microscillaceae bacterium]